MIELVQGNIFDADVEALVNPVNCVGVMGKGLALQFKNRFPENFEFYESMCDYHRLWPGKMLLSFLKRGSNPSYIINFPTKLHWRTESKIEYIKDGLVDLILCINRNCIKSIAIPPLGCGLGGLRWSDVRTLIENSFAELTDVSVLLYVPKECVQ